MYCQACAAENAADLSFCKRCGASLSTAPIVIGQPNMSSITKPAMVIGSTLTILTVGGFTSIIAGAVALAKTSGVGGDPVMAVVMLGMLTIMVVDILLARQLSRLITWSVKQPPAAIPGRTTQPDALPRTPSNPLLQVPSVTEHTTRTLPPTFRNTDPDLVTSSSR